MSGKPLEVQTWHPALTADYKQDLAHEILTTTMRKMFPGGRYCMNCVEDVLMMALAKALAHKLRESGKLDEPAVDEASLELEAELSLAVKAYVETQRQLHPEAVSRN